MIGRSPRKLSQKSYMLIQEIHREADRQRQIEAGLHYRPHNMTRTVYGAPVPLHIGPEIELKAEDQSRAA